MTEPARTPDGRYIVVDGRRWRASDPAIPEGLRAELVSELMAARRAVRDASGEAAERHARDRVQDAKVALGERGTPWWEEPTEETSRRRLESTMRALLRKRDATSTICPSDAARVAGGDIWRDLMPLAREVADDLARRQEVVVLRSGKPVDSAAAATGPVRIARGPAFR